MIPSHLAVQSTKGWLAVRRWFQIPVLVILSGGLTLIAAEGVLRVAGLKAPEFVTRELYRDMNKLYLPHQKAVWCGNLGNVRDYCNTVRTNALAFHDVDHAVPKPEGVYRVLFLGDSYLEAHQVPLEKTFFKVFEERARRERLPVFGGKKVETISLGRSGNGALREFVALRKFGLAYQPDAIVVLLTDQNDFDDDWHHERVRKGLEAKTAVNLRPPQHSFDKLETYRRLLVWPQSWLNRWIAFLGVQAIDRTRTDAANEELWKQKLWMFAKPESALFADTAEKRREALTTTASYYLEMKRAADAAGASFDVVFVDRSYDPRMAEYIEKVIPGIRSQLDMNGPVSAMKRFFAKQGISFLDLEDTFGRFPEAGRRTRFTHDGHWNPTGHGLAARALWEYFGRKRAGAA